ncbi:MAG: response regulator [Elusimicrobia bacterium]|nr:response regulator [Elusimicrobiota bacterium]
MDDKTAKKILVVDDELEMLNLIQMTLEGAGYRVATCENGRQAWESIQTEKPDLLILDVMLPGIDGYSLQIKMSQEDSTKHLPVIVLTALEPSRTLFTKFSQVAGFMTKPFKADELLHSVQVALRGK